MMWFIWREAFLPSPWPQFRGFDWIFDQWPISEVGRRWEWQTQVAIKVLKAVYPEKTLMQWTFWICPTGRTYLNSSFPRPKFNCLTEFVLTDHLTTYRVTKDGTRHDWGTQTSIPKRKIIRIEDIPGMRHCMRSRVIPLWWMTWSILSHRRRRCFLMSVYRNYRVITTPQVKYKV